MNARDHFKIASLTKTYTATVVLQLVAEGKLHLTDSIERWLPGLVPNGEQHHASPAAQPRERNRRLRVRSPLPEALPERQPRLLLGAAPTREDGRLAPAALPARRHAHTSYSNTNYVLLGLVVEAATRHSIGSELARRIFRPLQLDDSSYPTKPGLPRPYAHGYMVVGKRLTDVTGLSPSLSPASGGIVSTADDLLDFYRGLLSGRLLPADLLKEMKTTITEGTHVDIPGQRYGLGLELFPTYCGNALGHNGIIAGYMTFAYSNGEGSRQALLMVNLDAGSFPKAAGPKYHALIARAFCSRT